MPNWCPRAVHQSAGCQVSTVFTHGERTERLRARVGIPPSQVVPDPLAPWGGGLAPRLSQTFPVHHFPLSTFPLKKQPGVTSESAGQATQRLRSYSQASLPNPAGAAHELTAANAIYKFNSKTAAVHGKSVIHSCFFIFPLAFSVSSHSFLHMAGLCCWHTCAKQNQHCARCKEKEQAALPCSLTENIMT